MARVNPSGLENDFPCGGLLAALTFTAALGTLTISLFWPYMIPFAITTEQVATPHSSLTFISWCAGAFVLPFMLLYTAINYTMLRGQSRPWTAGSSACATISAPPDGNHQSTPTYRMVHYFVVPALPAAQWRSSDADGTWNGNRCSENTMRFEYPTVVVQEPAQRAPRTRNADEDRSRPIHRDCHGQR